MQIIHYAFYILDMFIWLTRFDMAIRSNIMNITARALSGIPSFRPMPYRHPKLYDRALPAARALGSRLTGIPTFKLLPYEHPEIKADTILAPNEYRPMAKFPRNQPSRLRSTTLPMTSGTGDLRLNEPGHRSSLRPTAYETMTPLRPPADGNRGTVKGPRPPNGTPARAPSLRHCH